MNASSAGGSAHYLLGAQLLLNYLLLQVFDVTASTLRTEWLS